MSLKLSRSQISRYQRCGMSYKHWYINKYRPTVMRSALLFGTALDQAVSSLLLNDGKKPEDVFLEYWTKQLNNNELVEIKYNETLVYAKTDFDKDLITDKDLKDLNITKEAMLELVERRNEKGGFDRLTPDEKKKVNAIFWTCLLKKGLYMVDAFRTKVMPKFTKVLAVQKAIVLRNGEDELVGFIDFIVEMNGVTLPVVCDLKTSSIEYEEDSVSTSEQLSIYLHAVSDEYERTRNAAYIVMNKNLIKNKKKICKKCGFDGSGGKHKTCSAELGDGRCHGEWKETINPEVNIQFIMDIIPEATENLVLENCDEVTRAIKAGIFTRNFDTCNNDFGSQCIYKNLCFKGKTDGLVKKD